MDFYSDFKIQQKYKRFIKKKAIMRADYKFM